MPNYAFPPDWVTRATACYLTSLTADQFDAYVRAGILPQPVKHGNKGLWDRQAINSALAALGAREPIAAETTIMEAAARIGTTKKDRHRAAAASHP